MIHMKNVKNVGLGLLHKMAQTVRFPTLQFVQKSFWYFMVNSALQNAGVECFYVPSIKLCIIRGVALWMAASTGGFSTYSLLSPQLTCTIKLDLSTIFIGLVAFGAFDTKMLCSAFDCTEDPPRRQPHCWSWGLKLKDYVTVDMYNPSQRCGYIHPFLWTGV